MVLVANDLIHQLFGDSAVMICQIVTSLSGVEQFFLDIFFNITYVNRQREFLSWVIRLSQSPLEHHMLLKIFVVYSNTILL